MPPLYAQFDGDEIDGKRYKLGEKIDPKTNPAVIAVLSSIGRLAESKPEVNNTIPSVDDEAASQVVDSDPNTARRRARSEA